MEGLRRFPEIGREETSKPPADTKRARRACRNGPPA
jgi:hypothetical protein